MLGSLVKFKSYTKPSIVNAYQNKKNKKSSIVNKVKIINTSYKRKFGEKKKGE